MNPIRVALFSVLLVAACASSRPSNSDGISTAVLRDYESAFNARDARAIATLYAEDGLLLPPGRPVVTGRDAIEKFWGGSVGGRLHLAANRVDADGSLATVVGRYEFEGVSGGGKFVLVLRRESGVWKIVVDTWNSDGE